MEENWKFNTSVFSAASAWPQKSVASAGPRFKNDPKNPWCSIFWGPLKHDHSQQNPPGFGLKGSKFLSLKMFQEQFFFHTHRISHAQWPKNKQVLKDVPHVFVDQTKKKHAWVPGRVCGYRLRLQSPPGGGKDGRHNVLSVEIPGWSLKQTNLKNTIHSTYIHHLAYL